MRVAVPVDVSRTDTRPLDERAQGWREPIGVAILGLLFYALTGARGMQWGDPAKLTLAVHDVMINLSQEGHAGLVLWSWPFSLLPIEPYALRLHLSSAFTMGLALGVAHATLLRVGISRGGARLAIAAIAVAHTLWFTSTMFESYPLVLLVIATSIWFLVVPGKPLVAGLLLGAGMTVHPLVGFGLPGILYAVWRSRAGSRGAALVAVGTFAAAAVAFGVPILLSPESGLEGFNWREATASYAGWRYPLRNIPLLLGYVCYNFASPALILLALGWWQLPRTWKVAFLLFALPHYLVAAFWLPQRSYLIPVPVYFVLAYPIALSAQKLVKLRPALGRFVLALIMLMPIAAYWAAPVPFTRAGLDRSVRDAPYRHESTYFLRPWKFNEYSAEDYLDDLGGVLPQGSAAVGDWVLYTTLYAAQSVSGWREDITMINADESQCSLVAEHLARRARVYVLDDEYLPPCLLAQGKLVRVPVIESLSELVTQPGE
jgi:hypothetical protein